LDGYAREFAQGGELCWQHRRGAADDVWQIHVLEKSAGPSNLERINEVVNGLLTSGLVRELDVDKFACVTRVSRSDQVANVGRHIAS
jgi:hypothetical protein